MLKKLILVCALLMLPVFGWGSDRANFDYFNPIPMAEVLHRMHQPGVVIFDANDQEIWQKHHIPGAVHIGGDEVVKFLPPDQSTTLIFYCAGPLCRSSADAANEAVMLGFRRVYVMIEGIFGWVKAGNPVESGAPAPMEKGSQREMEMHHEHHGGEH